MTDRPTRRGFLAACSAAAAALGLTARAAPVQPPILPRSASPSPSQILTCKAGEKILDGDCCYIGSDGLVRRSNWISTEIPFIVAMRGGSSGATVTVWVPPS